MTVVRFAPIHPTRRSHAVVDQIRNAILKGDLQPGDRLPPERELVEQFQVSRASVREALRMLEVLGFVEVQPGSGCYVRDLSNDVLRVPLRDWLTRYRTRLADLFEFRQIVEAGAAQFAAERAVGRDLKAMSESLDVMAECVTRGDVVGAIVADSAFHQAVWRAAGNHLLHQLNGMIIKLLEESRKASLRVPGQPERALVGHRQIYEAIKARSAQDAARAMRKHLEDAWFYIQQVIVTEGPTTGPVDERRTEDVASEQPLPPRTTASSHSGEEIKEKEAGIG